MVTDKYSEPPFYDVARITRVGNLVVNIEVANQAWIDDHATEAYFYFEKSPGSDGKPALINYHYDPETGCFEQPPVVPAPEEETA
jgi:hypothetical protein